MHDTCPLLLMTTTDGVQRLGDARCFLAALSLPSRPVLAPPFVFVRALETRWRAFYFLISFL